MSNDNNVPPNSPVSPGSGRRASFSPGQTISEIFGSARSPSQPSSQFPNVGPITTAAANAQRRRMSISGASPTQSNGFFGGGAGRRRESMSSQGSTSTSSLGNSVLDENAVEEGDGPSSPSLGSSSFARRVSFGARALRDARNGSVGSASAAGFNLGDSFKNRAENSLERNTSISERRRSDAMPVQPAAPKPVEQQRPDAFQERILKGDFYMD